MNDTRPSKNYFAITPHDSTDFAETTRGIYVGTGGNVVAVRADGTAITFSNVPSGTILPIIAKRVNSTSTTASTLVGLP
jgi:hypothetical protein